MRVKNVLIISRKSLYQIYIKEHRERAIQKALSQGDSAATAIEASHQHHYQALEQLKQTLRAAQIKFTVHWRSKNSLNSNRAYDLLISLGGDGTLLDTSHQILDETPVISINSDPERSIGALCAGTAKDFPILLEQILQDDMKPRKLTRMQIKVDDQEVLGPTLNDVLFAHVCPAGLTRFDMAIRLGNTFMPVPTESIYHARCSGLWVATSTGSTAGIHSAGGKVMPFLSKRLQFLLREPYVPPRGRLQHPRKGFLNEGQSLYLVSRMRRSAIWADGVSNSRRLQYGQTIQLSAHPVPLTLFHPGR